MITFNLNKIKLENILIAMVAYIACYFIIQYEYPQPPFISGIAFALLSLVLFK